MRIICTTCIALLTLVWQALPREVLAQRGPEILWQRCLGGTSLDRAASLLPTADGGYVIAGSTNSSNDGDVGPNHGGSDLWLTRLSATGTTLWNICIGGTGDEYATAVAQSADGGFVVVGYSDSREFGAHSKNTTTAYDGFIAKVDANGLLQWQHILGGTGDDIFNGLAIDIDGRITAVGTTHSSDGDLIGIHSSTYSDAWVVQYAPDGTLLRQRCLGGITWDRGNCIISLNDGHFLVGGYSDAQDTSIAKSSTSWSWVINVDSTLRPTWQRGIDTSRTAMDEVHSLLRSPDGSIYAIGSFVHGIAAFPRIDSTTLTRYPATCGVARILDTSVLWVRSLRGPLYDRFYAGAIDSSGGMVACGFTEAKDSITANYHGGYADAWLVRFDSAGKLSWQRAYGGRGRDEARSIVTTPDGGFAVVGFTNSTDGDVSGYHEPNGYDAWMVKLGHFDEVGREPRVLTDQPMCSIVPTGTSGVIVRFNLTQPSRVAIEIDDILGRRMRLIDFGFMNVGDHSQYLDLGMLPAGTYHALLNTVSAHQAVKFELTK